MKKWILSIVIFIYASLAATAQEDSMKFYLDAPDTVAVGEAFEISFTSKNANGNFVEPNWGNLEQVRSSRTSSNMSIINGVTTSEKSWVYIVVIDKAGTFTINPASLVQKEHTLKTDWEKVVAIEGYVMPKRAQSPSPFGDFWGRKTPEKEKAAPKEEAPKKKKKFKRKKKTYRI